MSAVAALLTLADARLPTGGHAHSGGVEQAILAGFVTDAGSLADFLDRRLHTAGPVAAALAASACRVVGRPVGLITEASPCREPGSDPSGRGDGIGTDLADLDAEADARTPSPALRGASRALGRGLTRLGQRAWPHPAWDGLPDSPHHSIALGVAAATAGLNPVSAAHVAAYLTISGPATAAQRLLSLDPLIVAAMTAGLCAAVDAVADRAAHDDDGPKSAATALSALCALSDPWFDLLAETHASRKDRLFAS
jgi:urease accessory protein